MAIELLLARALVLSEGQRSSSTTAGAAFFGSLAITIDLAHLRDLVRDTIDETVAERVVTLLDGEPRFSELIRAIAEREAERLSQGPAPLRSLETKLTARRYSAAHRRGRSKGSRLKAQGARR